jgi:hypothetical protein
MSNPIHTLLSRAGVFFFIMLVTGCAPQLRINTDFVPAGSLRLAQVIAVGKRAEVLQNRKTYDAIIASGITDSDVTDGKVVLARVY